MFNKIIRWFKRNSLSSRLHTIEKLIAEKRYGEAQACAFIALKTYPDNPELLQLKQQAESFFYTYLYKREF